MSVAGRLRRARERAGLSMAELADRMGVSKATVAEVEGGADPRRSTAVAWLDALPELAPEDLIEPSPHASAMSGEEAWDHYRDLFGFEAEAIVRRTQISAEGHAFTRVEMRGLHRVREASGDLRLVIGGRRAFFQREPTSPVDLSAPKGTRQRRRLPPGEATAEQWLSIPSDAARRGARLIRRFVHRGAYDLHARPEDLIAGPVVSGVSQVVVYPARKLSLSLVLPPDYRPGVIEAFVWPNVQVPDPDRADASRALHAAPLVALRSESGRTVRLRVDKPLVGFKYGIGWELPVIREATHDSSGQSRIVR